MKVPDSDILYSHFRLKFPFYPQTADQYLKKLLLHPIKDQRYASENMEFILEEIIRNIIENEDPYKIIIPLTAGLDSRGILGAVLRNFPKEKILCLTYGSTSDQDVIGAKRICNRLRLDWNHIDINNTVWEIDKIMYYFKIGYNQTGSYVTVKNSVMQAAINKIAGKGSVVLSGYLGDAVSGSHLKQGVCKDPSKAVEEFIKWNDSNIKLIDYNFEIETLIKFVKKWMSILEQFDYSLKVTPSDILDLGFRQGIRIKSIAGGFYNLYSPYEDPRWISYWYHLPIDKRINQSHYRSELFESYPSVFSLPNRRSNYSKIAIKIKKLVGKNPKWQLPNNSSMKKTFKELILSLDSRDVFNGFKFKPILNSLFNNPTRKKFNAINTAASIECHIRVGNYN